MTTIQMSLIIANVYVAASMASSHDNKTKPITFTFGVLWVAIAVVLLIMGALK